MGSSLAPLLLLGLAFVLANLPFLTQRVLLAVGTASPKHIGWHLVELLAYYALTVGVGWLMEKQAGQMAPQGWEFYAITGTLFLTLAFPGFVYRYLWKHKV